MEKVKKVVKLFLNSLGIFVELVLSLTLLYVILNMVNAMFISEDFLKIGLTKSAKNIEIAIVRNGIHTDILVPMKNDHYDWEKTLSFADERQVDTFQTHLRFGWGNRDFYLKTKDWSDLTLTTAINAIFSVNESAMHISLCSQKDLDKKTLTILHLSENQYLKLCTFIKNGFRFKKKKPIRIHAPEYGTYDFFFESSWKYHSFNTCNTWTNDALKTANQAHAPWAGLPIAIIQK